MVDNNIFMKRFLNAVNQDVKAEEKKAFKDCIDNMLANRSFTMVVESENSNSTTYRINYDPYQIENIGLNLHDVEDILTEYKDNGYRCSIDRPIEQIPNYYVIHFQIFVKVNETPKAIPCIFNYITLDQCEILKA